MSLRVTELWANVDPAKSKLTFSGTKLELAMAKESKVQWKTLEAKETEAKVLFGQPAKMINIWPDDIREALPEELQVSFHAFYSDKFIHSLLWALVRTRFSFFRLLQLCHCVAELALSILVLISDSGAVSATSCKYHDYLKHDFSKGK